MPNRKYEKGRRKEYRIVNCLKDMGFDIAQRSAGSHSPIDVFGFKKSDKTIILVQSKPEGYKSKEYDDFKWLNGKFDVKFVIW